MFSSLACYRQHVNVGIEFATFQVAQRPFGRKIHKRRRQANFLVERRQQRKVGRVASAAPTRSTVGWAWAAPR